jgi:putative DNA primase/helicase
MHIADQLHAAGLPVFPCWTKYDGAKGKWLKGPSVGKGQHWADAAAQPPASMHWPCGVVGVPIPRGVVVIDLDAYKPDFNMAAITAAIGDLPLQAAQIQTTISGGAHYAFRAPADWEVRQGDSVGKVSGLDTRCAGKGFICTGEGYTATGFGVFAMLHPQALPLLPDSCRAVLEKTTPAPSHASTATTHTAEDAEVLGALLHVPPTGERDEWRGVGMAVRAHFKDDSEGVGFEAWDEWSAKGDNYNPDDQRNQWDSFKWDKEGGITVNSLFHKAMAAGYRPAAGFDTSLAFGPGAAPDDEFRAMVERIVSHGADPREMPAIVDELAAFKGNAAQVGVLVAQFEMYVKGTKQKMPAAMQKRLDGLIGTPYLSPVPTAPAGEIIPPHQPLHPDCWATLHTKGKDNKPKGTQDNFEIMLRAYGAGIRFNEISKETDIVAPGLDTSGTLGQEAALSYLDHLANLNDYPKADNRAMAVRVAHRHSFNPVIDWLNGVPWDGHNRTADLFRCLVLHPDEDVAMAEMLFCKWLRGAVAIGTGRASRMEYVLTLVDPKGGTGKTRFFASLCPQELRKDGVILDTSKTDSIKIATSYWLVELGELDGTFNRSERGKLKAFLSEEVDEIRLPYGRTYIKYPRRTAFFASVNSDAFLVDDSGNRRFWPIRVLDVNHQHNIDMQQVWAQVQVEINSGATWYLTPDENNAVAARNEDFKSLSPVAEALSSTFGPCNGQACGRHVGAGEALQVAGFQGTPRRGDMNEAATWLDRNGYVRRTRNGKRGFMVPEFVATPATAAAFPPLKEVK